MRSIATALLCILTASTALAQTDAQRAESQRYQACLDRISQSAEDAFEDALTWRNDGGGWPAQHCHARSLVALGEIRAGAEIMESIASIQRPGMLDHERLAIWLEAGEIWLEAGDYSAAEGAFSVAMALDESNPRALAGRGLANLKLEIWAQALADADAALMLNSGDAASWRVLAEAHLARGDALQAQSAIITATRLEPDNIEGLLLRGRINEAIRLAEG